MSNHIRFQHNTIVVSRDNTRSGFILTPEQAEGQGIRLAEGEFAVNLRDGSILRDPLFAICTLDGKSIDKGWDVRALRVTMHTVATTAVERADGGFALWGTRGEVFGKAGASWLVREDRIAQTI